MQIVKINFKGHFILDEFCHWYLHHHVGKYCVSSIGDFREEESLKLAKKYTPWSIGPNNMLQLGMDRWFETLVVPLSEEGCEDGIEECNCPHGGGRELLLRGYRTEAEAERGHMSIIQDIDNGWIPDEPGVITQLFDWLEEEVESQKEV